MTSLKEYQERIDALARAKGWSDDLHWLELGIFKEVGELQARIEKHEDWLSQMMLLEAPPAYISAALANTRRSIAKEFGDVIFFLFQTMHHYEIDLDEALEMVIKDNTERKKKTIDANGEIVRK